MDVTNQKTSAAQKRAIQSYRKRLRAKGFKSMSIWVTDTDADAIRDLVRGLKNNKAEEGKIMDNKTQIINELQEEIYKHKGSMWALGENSILHDGIIRGLTMAIHIINRCNDTKSAKQPQ